MAATAPASGEDLLVHHAAHDDSPEELRGDDVVGDPVHQALGDGPEIQVDDAADQETDQELVRRAPVHLLERDRDDVCTEVHHAGEDSVEEVHQPDQDEQDRAHAVEVGGVVVVVEEDAHDH